MTIKELLEKYQDVEITEEQAKQIKDILGIKESKKWKPEKGENYYYIMSCGEIESQYFNNIEADKFRILTNNYFKTREEAEFRLEQIKVYNELKNFADENNEEIDWECDEPKYYCYFSSISKNLVISDISRMKDIGQIYFSSRELAEQAIKKVGVARIKKYLFGVE